MGDPFHPDLTEHTARLADEVRDDGTLDGGEHAFGFPAGVRLHRVRAAELSSDTAQSAGMTRYEAISGKRVGAERLWMGRVHVAPQTRSADHHHGESETAIYVVSGHPVFVFLAADGEREVRLETEPGDYVFIPPHVPHREENPDHGEQAVVVIARSTQEAIVVNLASLRGEPASNR